MKYSVIITPRGEATIKEFTGDHPLRDAVDGWVQECGRLQSCGKNLLLYCNDSYALREDLEINLLGSYFSSVSFFNNSSIYGNVLVLCDGLNDNGELDALPFELEEALNICKEINQFATFLNKQK